MTALIERLVSTLKSEPELDARTTERMSKLSEDLNRPLKPRR